MINTRNILLACLATLSWSICTNATTLQRNITIPDDDDNKATAIVLDENDLPEGMTLQEMDSLVNNWIVRQHIDEETCAPSSTDPVFPKEVYVERLSRMQTVVEMPYNDIVRSYIDRYTQRMRRGVSVMLGACNFYMPIFEEALESYQVPLELKYLPIIESALNPGATSRAGAAGLWQFMIGTGKRYGLEVTSLIDERRDPIKSSYAAAHFLSELYKMFGNWTLCVAAYNCGPGNVTKAIKRAGGDTDFWSIYPYLPKETRGYVPAFIAATYVMTYYCEHNICPVETRLPAATDTLIISRPLHFKQVALATGLDIEEIKALNPQYRSNTIPGNAHPCTLRLPMDAINAFLEAGDSIYNDPSSEYFTNRREIFFNEKGQVVNKTNSDLPTSDGSVIQEQTEPAPVKKTTTKKTKTVKVKPGDTLGAIAARNHTTVAKIKKANGLRSDRIMPGQTLRIN